MSLAGPGAVGEFIAAVLVMVTLVDPCVQVRQNVVAPLTSDRHVAGIRMTASGRYHSVDATDRERMVFFEWRVISAWSHYYHMHEKDLIDVHFWRELAWTLENLGWRQFVQEA